MKKFSFVLLMMIFLVACGSDEQATNGGSDAPTFEETSSLLFQNLQLIEENATFVLSGDVRSADLVFYYKLEQGETEIFGEKVYELTGDVAEWHTFEISEDLPEEVFESEEAPILTLYAKSSDGERIHSNFIPIDLSDE